MAALDKASAASPATARITIGVDAAGSLILVTARGFLAQNVLEAHFRELSEAVDAQRRLAPVRVLCDLRESLVQTGGVAQLVQQATEKLYRPGDRVALLLSSRLLGIQLRRVTSDKIHRVFESHDAATEWLSAD